MVVGMNPGAEEDAVGIPFIGPSGKKLNQLLEQVGLDRSRLYITNAVKCRTYRNDEPEPAEINACSEYLEEEVRSVLPEVCLALGNVALRALTGHSGIGNYRFADLGLHSRFKHTAKVVATYHPAATMYHPKYEHELVSDLRRFRAAVEGRYNEIPIRFVEQ